MIAQIEREPGPEQVELAVETLKLLADQTRLRILWALLHGEHSVSNLAEHVGAQPSAVSQHLAKLRMARLVRVRREGNRMFYAAENAHVRRLVEEALFHADHLVGGQPAHHAGKFVAGGEETAGVTGEHGHSHHDHDLGPDHSHGHRGERRGFVLSLLRPHSHDPADSTDAALEASREGMRALRLSLGVLAVTAIVQVVIVAASGSVALLSDTIHNFADALTAVPLGLAFWLGLRPATKRYTYGYGRSEDLAGVFIVATIALSSAAAAYAAVNRLIHPHHVHQVGWVILAGLVGFAGNELVAVYRVGVGRRIGSAALVADGMHARTDGFTSLAVVIGAVGVALGWQIADPIVGLVITLAILAVVRNAARDIYRRLMDAVDPALVDQVIATVAGVDGIDSVEAVRIRWVGHELHAEAEVTSDGRLTLAQAHDAAEQAHHHLLHEVPRLAQATIHTSPSVLEGVDPHALTAHHFRPTAPERAAK